MYKPLWIAGLALILSMSIGGAVAAESSQQDASGSPDEATMKAAAELVEQRYKGQMNERLRQGMKRTLLQSMPKLRQHPDAVEQFVNENTSRGALAEYMKREYAKRFTKDELEKLTEFYKTDVGQKTLQVVPEIESGAMRWSMKKLQQNSASLRQKIQEAQQSQGGGQSGDSGGQSGGSMEQSGSSGQ